MRSMQKRAIPVVMTGLAIGLAAAVPARAADITGAGSTFAAPIYGAWGAAAKSAMVSVMALASPSGVSSAKYKHAFPQICSTPLARLLITNNPADR